MGIDGATRLCEGQQSTYVATGAPAGGTYQFDITVGQTRNCIYCAGGAADRVTLHAVDDEGVAFLNVTYIVAGQQAHGTVRIELCEGS